MQMKVVFLEHFKFYKPALWDFSPSGAVTVSSQPSYFPDCEFDIKKEGGFILRTSSLTSYFKGCICSLASS